MLPLALLAATAVALLRPVLQSKSDAPAKDPRAAFEASMTSVSRSMDAGKWAQARDEIVAALATHGDADYVVAALPGIQEDLADCSFWSTHARPKPQDVVAGELVTYQRKTGEIKLRYQPAKQERSKAAKVRKGTLKLPFENDFEETKELYVHPLVFQGPYTLEIRCGPIGKHQPRVLACLDEGDFYLLFAYSPAVIFRVQDGERQKLEVSTNSLATDQRMRFKVEVRDTKVALSGNGALLASCDKIKGAWGQVGFYDFPDVEEIVLSGTAESSWIEGQIDEEIEKARAEFEKTYDARADLPEKLRVRAASVEQEKEVSYFAMQPGGDSSTRTERINKTGQLVEKRAWSDGLKYASSWTNDADAALRAWYRALFLLMTGKVNDALVDLGALAKLDPAFWPARGLLAHLRAETQSRARSLAEAQELVRELAKEASAREWLATVDLMLGRIDDARGVLDAAQADGISAPGLDRLRRVLARAERGPSWSRSFEHTTEHYEIRSDISKELCYDAGHALEAMYGKLDVNLRRVGASAKKQRFRVYLFAGRSGYLGYAADVLGDAPEQTAGVYSPVLKQLLVWNLPEREAMLRTIRHEGFHQYFDQVTDHAPRWLNEGLAEYFELSRRVGGRWKDGIAQPAHLELLAVAPLVPLAEFLPMGSGMFYANSRLHYAQGWALVHFLLNSKPAEKKRFDALLDGLMTGEETNALLERLFPEKELHELEQRLKEHIDSIR